MVVSYVGRICTLATRGGGAPMRSGVAGCAVLPCHRWRYVRVALIVETDLAAMLYSSGEGVCAVR